MDAVVVVVLVLVVVVVDAVVVVVVELVDEDSFFGLEFEGLHVGSRRSSSNLGLLALFSICCCSSQRPLVQAMLYSTCAISLSFRASAFL